MIETTSAATPGEEESVPMENDEERSETHWYVVLARELGRAVRGARAEAGVIGDAIRKVAAAVEPAGDLPADEPVDVGPLLRELGAVVVAHAHDEYQSLRDDARFWELIDRLHASGPEDRAGPAERVADASVDEDESAETPKEEGGT